MTTMNDNDDGYSSDEDSGYSSDEDSAGKLRNINLHTKKYLLQFTYGDDVNPLIDLQNDNCHDDELFIGTDKIPEHEEFYHFPVLPHKDDWGRTGEYIGKAKKLEHLMFGTLEGVQESNIVSLCKGGLLQNKSIKKFSIECDGDFLGGRGFVALSSYFERTTSLESMSFDMMCVDTATQNDAFAAHLAGALSKFSSLKSFESHLNPKMAHKVLASLAGHKGLERIHLRSDTSLGKKASSALSGLLRGKPKLSTVVLQLRLDDCNYMFGGRVAEQFRRGVTGMLGNDGMYALSSALCGKNSVKHLTIPGNQNISRAGWGAFATLLKSSRSVLQQLDMGLNFISDEGAILIANALSQNKVLRKIDLSSTTGITDRGWKAFCRVFDSEDSVLEMMSLWDCYISDDVHVSWASSLANNKHLKDLNMTYCPRMRDRFGMIAFQRLLCNESSIMDTFLSNHTLEEVKSGDYYRTPNTPELEILLKINKDNNAFDAAREKIIMHHSSEVVQIFQAMELGLLPDALAWMGKHTSGSNDCPDEGSKFNSGGSMLFDFLRTMPGLFEGTNADGARKRKRE